MQKSLECVAISQVVKKLGFDSESGEVKWDLPNGEYAGVWHAYMVRFSIGENEYHIKMKDGMRDWADVSVVIADGIVRVSKD